MKELVRRLVSIRHKDDGATAVEYGLLIALIAVVLAAGAYGLGLALDQRFDDTKACVVTPGADC